RDARITSLRILALTLLRQIEALDEPNAGGEDNNLSFRVEVKNFEAALLRSALAQTGGRQRQAAKLLGMKAATFNKKVRGYHLDLDYRETKPSGVEEWSK